MKSYKKFINEGNIEDEPVISNSFGSSSQWIDGPEVDEYNEEGNDLGEKLEQDLFELERSEDAVKIIDYDIPIDNYEDIRNEQEDENERVSFKNQYMNLKIVLGVYFGGNTVLQKLENDIHLGLGSSDGESWYGMNMAYAVLSPYDIIYGNKEN